MKELLKIKQQCGYLSLLGFFVIAVLFLFFFHTEVWYWIDFSEISKKRSETDSALSDNIDYLHSCTFRLLPGESS